MCVISLSRVATREIKMKRILSLVLAFASIIGSLVVFTGCGEPKDDGAQISVYLGESVYDFDPSDYYVDDNAQQLMSLIFEPLFTLNEKGKLKKDGAAKDYEVDEENRKITITLRETYWSDGVRVTAEHYVYAWRQLLMEPNKSNAAAALLYDIENAVEVKNGEKSIYEFGAVADGFDVVINYREGADYKQILKNLASLATAPVREDIAANASGYWTKSTNKIVTNGPFRVTRLDYATGDFVLERNVGYHQKLTVKNYTKQVNPGKLISVFSVNGEKVELSYDDIQNKTVFYMGSVSLADRADNKKKVEAVDALSTYTYVFNTQNPLFAKKEVRKALSLAIDRAAIINAVTFGKAATGFLPTAATEGIYSKKVAQTLISAEAKKAEAESLLAGVDFKGISKKFSITVNDDEESLKIAELVKLSWEDLGFTVTIKPVSTVKSTVVDYESNEQIEIIDSAIQSLAKKAAAGNIEYDVLALDWQMYSTDGFVGLASLSSNLNGNGVKFNGANKTNRGNIAGWTNAKYDAYIKAAYDATDDNARAENLRLAEAVLIDEAPVVPIMFNQNVAFIGKHLSKVEVNAFGNFNFNDAKQKKYKKYIQED